MGKWQFDLKMGLLAAGGTFAGAFVLWSLHKKRLSVSVSEREEEAADAGRRRTGTSAEVNDSSRVDAHRTQSSDDPKEFREARAVSSAHPAEEVTMKLNTGTAPSLNKDGVAASSVAAGAAKEAESGAGGESPNREAQRIRCKVKY